MQPIPEGQGTLEQNFRRCLLTPTGSQLYEVACRPDTGYPDKNTLYTNILEGNKVEGQCLNLKNEWGGAKVLGLEVRGPKGVAGATRDGGRQDGGQEGGKTTGCPEEGGEGKERKDAGQEKEEEEEVDEVES